MLRVGAVLDLTQDTDRIDVLDFAINHQLLCEDRFEAEEEEEE